MRCPYCDAETPLGMTYCVGCGKRLDLTESQARLQAVAEVRYESWRKACLALNRTVFLFFLVFLVSVLFSGYAHREVVADFSAGAPLPPVRPLGLTPTFVPQPELGFPALPAPMPLAAEKTDENEIVSELAQMARDRLNCTVYLKTGGVVKGVLLSRTADEILVITEWGTPDTVRPIKTGEAELGRSQLPF